MGAMRKGGALGDVVQGEFYTRNAGIFSVVHNKTIEIINNNTISHTVNLAVWTMLW